MVQAAPGAVAGLATLLPLLRHPVQEMAPKVMPLFDSDTPRRWTISTDISAANGQIEDEVYEYGSSRESKMFSKGVT